MANRSSSERRAGGSEASRGDRRSKGEAIERSRGKKSLLSAPQNNSSTRRFRDLSFYCRRGSAARAVPGCLGARLPARGLPLSSLLARRDFFLPNFCAIGAYAINFLPDGARFTEGTMPGESRRFLDAYKAAPRRKKAIHLACIGAGASTPTR